MAFEGFCAHEYEYTNHIIIYLSLSIPVRNAHAVYSVWAFAVFIPCFDRKGLNKMMNTQQYREHIECTFNAFCKIVLYYAVLVAYKELKRKQQFKVSLDYLRGMFSESAPPKKL